MLADELKLLKINTPGFFTSEYPTEYRDERICYWLLNRPDCTAFLKSIIWSMNSKKNIIFGALVTVTLSNDIQIRLQDRFHLNVWSGICTDQNLVRTYNLLGEVYFRYFRNPFEYLPILECILRYMRHLETPLKPTDWTEYLIESFGNKWIGNAGPVL